MTTILLAGIAVLYAALPATGEGIPWGWYVGGGGIVLAGILTIVLRPKVK